MLVKDAEKITGSLSEPSKMPGYGYGLPISACTTGSKLADNPKSKCFYCYAGKGHYAFSTTIDCHNHRLSTLRHPLWVAAMIAQLKGKRVRYFRWHDSGDLQGEWHLNNIVRVAKGVPDMMFWLPTTEKMLVVEWLKKHPVGFPPNLCVRISASLMDAESKVPESARAHVQTCTVHWLQPAIGHECPAPKQDGKCGECRACWDTSVKNVSYKKH